MLQCERTYVIYYFISCHVIFNYNFRFLLVERLSIDVEVHRHECALFVSPQNLRSSETLRA
jgi:hypothetical protein